MSKDHVDNFKQHLIKDYGMTSVTDDVENILIQYSKQLISNIINNGYQVAVACKAKTITLGHLITVNSIQLKSIGQFPQGVKKGGGHTVHSSEYFGKDSGVYDAQLTSRDMFTDLNGGYSRSGINSTFSGGGIDSQKEMHFMSDKAFVKYVAEVKGTLDNIRISKDAMDIIKLSVDLNIDMLLKFITKKMRIKRLNGENIKKCVGENKRRFGHFLKN